MTCCQCQGIETRFDRDYVSKKLDAYRRHGPKGTSQSLIDAIKRELEPGMTLLDIGGGVGEIQHALLAAGASAAVGCEASMAYLEAATEEAERQGNAARLTQVHGDFVDVCDRLDLADIVTLDRVICCYHDMGELVTKSMAKARRLYGVVIPRDVWWVKLWSFVYYNLRFILQGNPFRIFVHPVAKVEDLLRVGGFSPLQHRRHGGWLVALYSRD